MKKRIGTQTSITAEIIAALLLIFMIHTLVSSYVQLQSLKNLLAFYTANTENSTIIAWLIVLSEFFVVILLFFPRTRVIGLIGVLVLMLFAASIMWVYPRHPHHFGGIINKIAKNDRRILVAVVAVISIIGIIFSLLKKRPSHQAGKDGHVAVYS